MLIDWQKTKIALFWSHFFWKYFWLELSASVIRNLQFCKRIKNFYTLFLLRNAMVLLQRMHMLWSCVCVSHAGIVSKRRNRSSSFLAQELCCNCKEILLSPKLAVFLFGTFPKFWTRKISPRRVHSRRVHQQATVVGMLLTTLGVGVNSRLTTVACLLHSASSIVYSAMGVNPRSYCTNWTEINWTERQWVSVRTLTSSVRRKRSLMQRVARVRLRQLLKFLANTLQTYFQSRDARLSFPQL